MIHRAEGRREGHVDLFLCRLDDIPDGHSRGFDPQGVGRDTMFIVRRGATVHGWRNSCPHYDFAPMAWRKDAFLSADGLLIQCGAHGALFKIEDGECVLGPCLGKRLTPVSIEIRQGELWVVEVDNSLHVSAGHSRAATSDASTDPSSSSSR